MKSFGLNFPGKCHAGVWGVSFVSFSKSLRGGGHRGNPNAKMQRHTHTLLGNCLSFTREPAPLQYRDTDLHISTPLLAEAILRMMIPRQPGKKMFLEKQFAYQFSRTAPSHQVM